MALIIKGDMPTCCGLCCECLGGGSDAYYCNRAKRQISEVVPPYDKRMEWCPILGEIPDNHGRLKDYDKIKEVLTKNFNVNADSLVYYILGLIDETDTVAEAST